MANEKFKHPIFKSDHVVDLACFDYGTLFHLPKPQAHDCCRHIFQSFSSRGWLSRELRKVHMEDYVEFVDDVRHIYLDEFGIEDMVFFLSACPDLARRETFLHFFKICCLCLGHIVPSMPKIELASGRISTANVDLSCIFEPFQGYLLSSDSERNFFTDLDSFEGCWASLENFCDKVLQTAYNHWSF